MRLIIRRSLSLLLLLGAMLTAVLGAGAAESEDPDPTVRILLHDGTTLIGQILSDDGKVLKFVTTGGLEIQIPKESVETIVEVQGKVVDGEFQLKDLNYSRLMFSPTGRPLKKGHGYFSDLNVLLPGFSYGVTDHFSVTAGMSIIPGIGVDDQLFYVAPRLGAQISENVAVSGGLLYASGGIDDDDSVEAGIGYGVATFGPPDKSFTMGLGFGFSREDGDVDWDDTPVVMLGGNFRLSNRLALVSENWFILHDDLDLGKQPFGISLRFLGERLSADIGAILIGDLLDEGIPVPWLSFSYHFGKP